MQTKIAEELQLTMSYRYAYLAFVQQQPSLLFRNLTHISGPLNLSSSRGNQHERICPSTAICHPRTLETTHTHTRTHARTHAHTHTHASTHACTHTHTHRLARAKAILTQSCTHVRVRARTPSLSSIITVSYQHCCPRGFYIFCFVFNIPLGRKSK